LLVAAHHRNYKIILWLMQNGVDVTATDSQGHTFIDLLKNTISLNDGTDIKYCIDVLEFVLNTVIH